MRTLSESVRRRPQLAALLLILVLAALAYANRFIQDDAFISFRYARHLAEGYGPTWNLNEPPVEGYTNFLWMLILAIPHRLGLPAVEFSYAAGLLCFVGTLALTWRAARHVVDDTAALLALLLLGTNYSFSAYATGGMETQLQAMLVMAAVVIVLDLRRGGEWLAARPLLALSSVCGLALLTRLDSAVLVGPLAALTAWRVLRQPAPLARRAGRLLLLALPVTALVLPWLVWKLAYYGDILPNTFYVKVEGGLAWTRGLHYLALFLLSYLWIPILPLLILSARRLSAALRWLLLPVGLWLLYLLYIGGDFMEYRMLVPVLPAVFIYFAWLCCRFLRNRIARALLVALVLAGSLRHALDPNLGFRYINTLPILKDEMRAGRSDGLIALGQALGEALPGERTVTIAINAAGAVPYYSQLTTIDVWGLNDRWVARHGIPYADQPGHARYAPWDYLLAREVHLLIGQPIIIPAGVDVQAVVEATGLSHYHAALADPALLPAEARLLEIPLGETHSAYVLYLRPHPAVEALIQAGTWRAHPIQY